MLEELPNGEVVFRLKSGACFTEEYPMKILDWIYTQAPDKPQEGKLGYSWDEIGFSQVFSELFEKDLMYCPEAKSWFSYDGVKWTKDIDNLQANKKIKDFFTLLEVYAKDTENTPYLKVIKKFSTKSARDKILKDATSVNPIHIEQFDTNPNLINCKNGTFDLSTFTLKEHSASDFITQVTNFSFLGCGNIFDDPYSQYDRLVCKRFERFVKEITCGDLQKAGYLQRILGYSLLGTQKEECMFILWGKTTRNGKSTLLNAIHNAMGDYSAVVPISLICRDSGTRDLNSASPLLASLQGKRLAIMSESSQHSTLDEEKIKSLTGGEEVSCRRLYEAPFSYLPQFKMWLSCNDLPMAYDDALFASDRIKVVEFTRHFNKDEQDKNLKTYFQSDEAMQGIFYWLVRGLYWYNRDGFNEPECVLNTIKQYQEENNLVLQFLGENCEQLYGASVKASDLYQAYKDWTRKNGYACCTIRTFNKEMKKQIGWCDKWHNGKGNVLVYDNIKLKSNYQSYVKDGVFTLSN